MSAVQRLDAGPVWPGVELGVHAERFSGVLDTATDRINKKFADAASPAAFYEGLVGLNYSREGFPSFVYPSPLDPEMHDTTTAVVFTGHFAGGASRQLKTKLQYFREILDAGDVRDQHDRPVGLFGIPTPAPGVDLGFSAGEVLAMIRGQHARPFADKILQTLSEHGIEQLVFLGFSAGGQISLETAALAGKGQDVLAVGSGSQPGNSRRAIWQTVADLVNSKGSTLQRLRDGDVAALLPPETDRRRRTTLENTARTILRYCVPPNLGLWSDVAGMEAFTATGKLVREGTPVTMVYGTTDRVPGPPEFRERWQAASEAGRMLLLWTEGNHCWGSNPRLVGELLLSTIAQSPNLQIDT